jgi:hypothetical protein
LHPRAKRNFHEHLEWFFVCVDVATKQLQLLVAFPEESFHFRKWRENFLISKTIFKTKEQLKRAKKPKLLQLKIKQNEIKLKYVLL